MTATLNIRLLWLIICVYGFRSRSDAKKMILQKALYLLTLSKVNNELYLLRKYWIISWEHCLKTRVITLMTFNSFIRWYVFDIWHFRLSCENFRISPYLLLRNMCEKSGVKRPYDLLSQTPRKIKNYNFSLFCSLQIGNWANCT